MYVHCNNNLMIITILMIRRMSITMILAIPVVLKHTGHLLYLFMTEIKTRCGFCCRSLGCLRRIRRNWLKKIYSTIFISIHFPFQISSYWYVLYYVDVDDMVPGCCAFCVVPTPIVIIAVVVLIFIAIVGQNCNETI